MTVFGLTLEPLLFFQVLITGLLLMLYFLTNSLKEVSVDNHASHQMVPLLSFLLKHRGEFTSFAQLIELRSEGTPGTYPALLGKRLDLCLQSGKDYEVSLTRPDISQFHLWQIVLIAIVATVLAPLMFVFAFLWNIYPGDRLRRERIETTEIRQCSFSWIVVMTVPNLLLFCYGLLIWPKSHWLALICLVVSGFNVVLALVAVALINLRQRAWKSFWAETFLGVMVRAEKADEHDLFNRALLLYNRIDAEPDFVLPGGIGFYSVLFGAVQGALFAVFRLLDLA